MDYGVQFLSANYIIHIVSVTLYMVAILADEPTNPNGTYKSIIHDSVNHLYYQRVNKPSENFGGNNPEKETRESWGYKLM